MMELSGNFFQEACLKVVETQRLQSFLSLLFFLQFFHFSSLLSLCSFLRKAQRNDKGPWDGHTLPAASAVPTSPACSIRNAVDGEGGGLEWPFPSLQTQELPVKAGLCFSWRGQEEEGSKGWLLSFSCALWTPKATRGACKARQGKDTAQQGWDKERSFQKSRKHIRPKEKMSLEQRSKNDNTKHLCSKHCTNIN